MSSFVASHEILQPGTEEHQRYDNIEDSDEASSKPAGLQLPDGGAADVAGCNRRDAEQGEQNTSDKVHPLLGSRLRHLTRTR
jgi:hypothetical protein